MVQTETPLELIRREMSRAPDAETRIQWRVLLKAMESGLKMDAIGEIADENGDLFVYAIDLRGALIALEAERLPCVFVSRAGPGPMFAVDRRRSLKQTRALTMRERSAVKKGIELALMLRERKRDIGLLAE